MTSLYHRHSFAGTRPALPDQDSSRTSSTSLLSIRRNANYTQAEEDVKIHHTRSFKYRTVSVDIDVGPCPWGQPYATYGRNGIVKGCLTFMKKCSSVAQVTVTLRGTVTVTLPEEVMIAGVDSKTIYSEQVVLFQAKLSGTSIQGGTSFPFTLSFPERLENSEVPLPPSYSIFHPVTAEVEHALQIEVSRCGFHKHERRRIPVLYLPKSSPETPIPCKMPMQSPGRELPSGIRRIDLAAVWPDDCLVPSDYKGLVVVQALLPTKCVFASGTAIPLALSIRCRDESSPDIVRHLSQDIDVSLVRRKALWLAGNRRIRTKDEIVANVEELRVHVAEKNNLYFSMELTAGCPGSEYSWGVPGHIMIQYSLRIIIRPPAYAQLPTFKHFEPITLRTDTDQALARQLVVSLPALGLTTLQPMSPLLE
ncbi:hypothetical protein BXZ70DRAFT_40063 [Cristinia sonorae]|uniref:Uncharacterized protein n=1 Tax=Cristinia sonorae TaxID=1940300 RepID=A0A8K0UYD5_9AGAR|nr:hypothetical protein BXZ70DRAFT_40063 [Cristinia sonorae]